jgi:hemerythrin
MAAMHLDPRHITQHQRNHRKFLEEVLLRHKSVVAASYSFDAGRSLLQFLSHWLAYHILGTDQAMAKQMSAVESGTRPEDAYLASNESGDAATDILLEALNGLFVQVTERNLELVRLNASLEARVDERTHALSEANQRLDDLANIDLLTGLPNRRHAMRTLAQNWEIAVRDKTALACMMIDADGFKTVNDTYGHDAGDAVLRALAICLSHSVRNDDVVCRLGGDEFIIICTKTPLEGALKLAEKVRGEISELRVKAGDGVWCGSISIGVAVRTDSMAALEELVKAADQGLYVAKKNGRNRVATVGERTR